MPLLSKRKEGARFETRYRDPKIIHGFAIREHSRKPDEVIRAHRWLTTPYLELSKKAISGPGWDAQVWSMKFGKFDYDH